MALQLRLGAVYIAVASVLLSGCNSYIPNAQATSVVTPGAPKQRHTRSWMLPEANKSALLYISTGSVVLFYTYPAGVFAGELSGLNSPEGLCSDKAGHIFVPDTFLQKVAEYAHGGTQPVATFTLDYTHTWGPIGCSVDPRTNNLAVQADGSHEVIIFKDESPNFAVYNNPYSDGYLGGTYDGSGNFFMRGSPNNISELPKGSSGFKNITVPGGIVSPQGFAWDGKYLSITNGDTGTNTEYRIRVHGTHATVVSKTLLTGAKLVRQFTIFKHRFIAPDQLNEQVTFWKYPAFGEPVGAIQNIDDPIGSAISVSR